MAAVRQLQRYLALLSLAMLLLYTPVIWRRSRKVQIQLDDKTTAQFGADKLQTRDSVATSAPAVTIQQTTAPLPPKTPLSTRTMSKQMSTTSQSASTTSGQRAVPHGTPTGTSTRPTGQSSQQMIRCGELPPLFPDSIPPIVHWTSKDSQIPAKLVPIMQSWRRLTNVSNNSSKKGNTSTAWQFMHWDDSQIALLIATHYPLLSRSYSKLVNGLERSDIGRLVVLHHVGGLYVDTDVELLRDPSPLLRPSVQSANTNGSRNFSACASAYWSQEPVEHSVFLFDLPSMISNAAMLSKANHSFLSYVLDRWPAWFEAKWAMNAGRTHNQAVFVTGPIMLQTFFDMYAAIPPASRPPDWCSRDTMLAHPDQFQPIWDTLYIPNRLRIVCQRPTSLSEMKRRHCQRLAGTKFQTRRVPPESFTIHRFMHLSYSMKMDKSNAQAVGQLLPILKCRIA